LKQKCALTEKGSMKQRRERGDDGEAEGTIRVKRRKTTEEAETGLERVERKLERVGGVGEAGVNAPEDGDFEVG
jgi:hypothetical protein